MDLVFEKKIFMNFCVYIAEEHLNFDKVCGFNYSFVDKDSFIANCKNDVALEIHTNLELSLLDYYKLLSTEKKITYSEYIDTLINDKKVKSTFFNIYSHASVIVTKIVDNYVENIENILKNFHKNINHIINRYSILNNDLIVHINPFLGDSHSNRIVAKIVFNNDKSLIYKNREPVGERLVMKLSEYLDISFILPKTDGSYVSMLKAIVKKFNDNHSELLQHITPHTFRHTFCTNLVNAGMNPKSLQYIMGHANIALTLDYYTHASFDTAKDEMIRIDML